MARKTLVVGNWKMNGALASNAELVAQILAGRPDTSRTRVALCVPFPYLAQVSAALDGTDISPGAQDVSEHESGAYTGDVSASMLVDCGCDYVIVGHSERRMLFHESSEQVAAKAERALDANLVPIVCVGETLAERDDGRAINVVTAQLDAVLDRIAVIDFAGCVVAYEPVWAIGTGRTATPDQAQAMHAAIRAHVGARGPSVAERLRILYGGSVKAANAASLFSCADIDGGLIGGASLVAAEFLAIVAA